ALLKHADSAMYRAKEQGRNNFQFFTDDLNLLMKERFEIENNLRRALTSGESISPGRFIPVAEETGLIAPIGEWVLRTACAQNKRWQEAGLPPCVVSVNVSPRQFHRDDFIDMLKDVLRDTEL